MKKIIYIFLVLNVSYAHADWQSENATIMGTTIRVELWHPESEIRKHGITKVLQEMERVNRLMSPYIENSQLSKINENAHIQPVKVDEDLFQVIQKSIEFSKLTNGAFDITFASVGYLYNYRKQQKPSDERIAEAKTYINYKNIILDETQHTVSFAQRGVKIDLGGIAKGYAVDQAIKHLKELNIEHALISAGGDTRLLGDRKGRPWLVGIKDPDNTEKVIVMLPLQNEALSTSGDYERFFIEDGVKYHHIIHPETGKSASEVRSASIIGATAITTDALSTSVFVMGVNAGLELLNSIENIEGLIVDQQGKLFYSKGLIQEQQ